MWVSGWQGMWVSGWQGIGSRVVQLYCLYPANQTQLYCLYPANQTPTQTHLILIHTYNSHYVHNDIMILMPLDLQILMYGYDAKKKCLFSLILRMNCCGIIYYIICIYICFV